MQNITRRRFTSCTTKGIAAAGVVSAVTQSARASTANDTIHIGMIGMGGRARGFVDDLRRHQDVAVTAVCDVDESRVSGGADSFEKAFGKETLLWMGVKCQLIEDVGVAGPQRLLRHVPVLQTMSAIVVVAGMEAALPSVIGGHVGCPIIGVPTSVGYGASLHGFTALLSMLTSCASNVMTVNIDAGFRGGYAAGLIARQVVHSKEPAGHG